MSLETDHQKLRSLFEAVAEAEPHVRQTLLASADQTLRAQAEELLRFDGGSHALLDHRMEITIPEAARLSEGDHLGRYRILRIIAEGGMGTVYQAELAEHESGPRYALKVVRCRFAESEKKLKEEIRVLSRLEHPNIARLLDVGTTSDGELFLVMEYVDGVPIHRHAAQHKLSPREIAGLFRPVCTGVRYLHQNLVLHLDLKPANILASADGGVKIVDFGIAHILATPEDTRATPGPMTPEYASPEQARGEPVSALTDIFALGITFYELLCGAKPFTGNALEVLRQIADSDPIRPREQNPATPVDLEAVVLKALKKNPDDRYASADQLDEDLRCFLAGLPVAARGGSLWYRARKFTTRNVVTVTLAALALVALGGGIVAANRQAAIANQERVRAESEAGSAQEQRIRAEQNEALADRSRAEAERRLAEITRLAQGAAQAYGASQAEDPAALLARNVRDSLLALGREGGLDAAGTEALDAASADLRSRALAQSSAWTVPQGWVARAERAEDYRIGVDREFRYQGGPSVFLTSLVPEPEGGAYIEQIFAARRYRGKRIRLSAALRVEKVAESSHLRLEAFGSEMDGDASWLSGTRPWQTRTLVIDVPETAETIHLSLALLGTGTVWAAQLSFSEVPRSVPLTAPRAPRNLDFTQ